MPFRVNVWNGHLFQISADVYPPHFILSLSTQIFCSSVATYDSADAAASGH